MLLVLRSLWESVSGSAATIEESSGGFWPAHLIHNLREANARKSAIVYLRSLFARAKAGDVTATGGASSVAAIQDTSAKAGTLHASGMRYLPSAQSTLRSPIATSRRATAGGASTEVRTAGLNAEGILGISEDELTLLMLAAA